MRPVRRALGSEVAGDRQFQLTEAGADAEYFCLTAPTSSWWMTNVNRRWAICRHGDTRSGTTRAEMWKELNGLRHSTFFSDNKLCALCVISDSKEMFAEVRLRVTNHRLFVKTN